MKLKSTLTFAAIGMIALSTPLALWPRSPTCPAFGSRAYREAEHVWTTFCRYDEAGEHRHHKQIKLLSQL
jgi:hypothetical protein